jgi:hypothetical protein
VSLPKQQGGEPGVSIALTSTDYKTVALLLC